MSTLLALLALLRAALDLFTGRQRSAEREDIEAAGAARAEAATLTTIVEIADAQSDNAYPDPHGAGAVAGRLRAEAARDIPRAAPGTGPSAGGA